MGKIRYTFSALALLLFISTSCSQEITAEEGSFGVDKKNGIIVWHQENLSSQKITTITLDKVYTLDAATKLSYDNAIALKGNSSYKLYITKLPIIHISMDESKINSRKKIVGNFSYFDSDQFVESSMGVRHRGNLSLNFDKKSFDLELWEDATSQEENDISLSNMRSDGDWILDAMYNEPLRLRSYVAAKAWNNIHKPYYASQEPEAKSGFEVAYVEVFKNNAYYGLYQLMESIDRKQLKVKKNDDKTFYGRMYRAESYEGGPDFTKAPAKYDNVFKDWIGWETYYPFLNYESDFEDLFQFQQLVVNSSDEEFKSKIAKAFVLNNAIDYYLFVNAIRATDNLGKNYTLAKYDKDEPYFIVPWDLDGTFGIIQAGKQIATTDDVLTNGLFKRLIAQNPDGYNSKLKSRWSTLRKGELSNKKLFSSIETLYDRFTDELIYEREQLVWKSELSKTPNKDHYKYLEDWLTKRLAYLDKYVNDL